ncbi:MAG: diguanylate cyclase [Candidatus Sumerlaeaceae bacterium]|nr:diguanylate cyclase [Candidatus Sumerlaeaceae bacterium]
MVGFTIWISILLLAAVWLFFVTQRNLALSYESTFNLRRTGSDFQDGLIQLNEKVWEFAETGNPAATHAYWHAFKTSPIRHDETRQIPFQEMTSEMRRRWVSTHNLADALVSSDTRIMKLVAESLRLSADQLPAELNTWNLDPNERNLPEAQKREAATRLLTDPAYRDMKSSALASVEVFDNLVHNRRARDLHDAEFNIYMTLGLLGAVAIFLPVPFILDYRRRRQDEARIKVLITMGERLSGVTSQRGAARLIADSADELIGWDACFVDIYDSRTHTVRSLIADDTVEGVRMDFSSEDPGVVSLTAETTMREGSQLILRTLEEPASSRTVPFGNKSQKSASLMFVPIRLHERPIGIISLQSYTLNAYTETSLHDLEWLASLCAAGLERAKVFEELGQSENRYRGLLGSIIDGVYLIQHEKLTYSNNAMCAMFGYDHPEEMIGKNVYDLCLPREHETMRENIRQRISGEVEMTHYTFTAIRRDGSTFRAEVQGRRIDYGGTPAILGTLKDVEKIQRVERRANVFASLGRKLSGVTTALEAARAVADAADDLFGWDACNINVFDSETGLITGLLYQDLINGVRCDVQSTRSGPVSSFGRKVLTEGPQIVLREPEVPSVSSLNPFGDTDRPSASLIFAPMRENGVPKGYLSFQSYRYHAYDEHDLADLQALADHCSAGIERARLYELLGFNEERFRTVWQRAGNGMRLTDSEGIIKDVNPAFCDLVGMPREQLVGKPFTVYYAEEYTTNAISRYADRFAAGKIPEVFERDMTLWNGRKAIFEVTSTFMTTSEGAMILGVFRDRTTEKKLEMDLKRYASDLERFATTDTLTGLYNRRHFLERLSHEVVAALRYPNRPLSILMMDLDHFKSINDTFGHMAGDSVLSRTGEIIREIIRVTDVAARYGGEEFCIFLTGTDLDGAAELARRLCQDIAAQKFTSEGKTFGITCSIGVQQLDERIGDMTMFLSAADKALYKAKQLGRNRVSVEV